MSPPSILFFMMMKCEIVCRADHKVTEYWKAATATNTFFTRGSRSQLDFKNSMRALCTVKLHALYAILRALFKGV